MRPASTVLFPFIGKNYEVTLGNLLRSAGYNVIEAGDKACFDDLYETICASRDGTSTVIVDIENISCISVIIRAAQTLVKKPNIIIITSLLTWCGEVSTKSITDPDTDFCSRVPLHCARKSYDLENALWNASLDSRPGYGYTYFVGIGLIYGGSGWDFEDSLRYRHSYLSSCSMKSKLLLWKKILYLLQYSLHCISYVANIEHASLVYCRGR